jgi:hypothetical protein
MFILPHLKGLLSGNLGSAAFKSAGLDLKFAANKSLVDSISGNSLVSFARAGSTANAATFVDSSGVLQTAVTNLLLQSEDLLTTWTANDGLARTANQTVSPNGSTTADLLASGGTLIGYLEQPNASSNQFVSGTTYTYSVYLKKANTSTCLTLLFGTTFNSGGGNPVATWNLDTGVPTFVNGATGSMTAVGNGWYRCVVTDTATQTHTQNQQWLRMSSASGDVYAWGAQLEQASTVGEYIPTTSAINSAPRFDHNPTTGESLGLLVEEARTNLLLRSEEFDNASWILGSTAVDANATTAPSGGTTAEFLKASAGGGGIRFISQTIAKAASAIEYTYSIYLKALDVTFATVGCDDGGGNGFGCGINLSTGQTTGGTVGTGGVFTSVSAVAVSNGWYRVVLTGTSTAGASLRCTVNLATSLTTGYPSVILSINQGIYVWGAQLEAGAFPTSYIPTTTATVTRAADVASISGSNFSSWFNANDTTLMAEGQFVGGTASTFPRMATLTSASTNSDEISLAWTANTGGVRGAVASGGVNTADLASGPNKSAGSKFRCVIAASSTSAQFASDGVLATEDTTITLPACNQLLIAQPARFQGTTNTTIRRLTYWPTRLANTTLQQITQP